MEEGANNVLSSPICRVCRDYGDQRGVVGHDRAEDGRIGFDYMLLILFKWTNVDLSNLTVIKFFL